MKDKRLGFTLVEIMIVVGIVSILAIIAVPNLLRSRVFGNETAAVNSLLAINNGCQLYHINNDTYPANLTDLIEPNSNPPYIESTLASGRKQNYIFTYQLVEADHFTVNASSAFSGLLKGRYFYIDETGVIHVNADSPAGPDDPIFR